MSVVFRVIACIIGAAIGLGACGTSPPERFFTLAGETPTRAADDARFSIVVGPVTVPEIVDRPQLVLRSGPNRVEIAEQARWAAPLKSEIPRFIAAELSRLLPGARTATSFERAAGVPDYRVALDIQRFESAPRESATIQASWTVRGKDVAVNGSSLATENAGAGYDELVAAHSRALTRIGRDIASAIEGARARPAGTPPAPPAAAP